jgi:hypothetical protein
MKWLIRVWRRKFYHHRLLQLNRFRFYFFEKALKVSTQTLSFNSIFSNQHNDIKSRNWQQRFSTKYAPIASPISTGFLRNAISGRHYVSKTPNSFLVG